MFSTVPGQTIADTFPAFEDDGVSKRSGLSYPGDFTVAVFKDCTESALSVAITEIGSTGTYCLQYTPPDEGFWKVEVLVGFSGDARCSQASVGTAADLSGIITNLERVLGLLHMNSFVDNQEFSDPDGQLTKWRLRHFDTAANLPVNEGGSETAGLLHEYEFEAEYDGPNQPKKLRVRKIL
jgi:hypothetical protein